MAHKKSARKQGRDWAAEKIEEYLKDGTKPLYPGCTKYTKLSFFNKLFQIKSEHNWSNESLAMLLEWVEDFFPGDNSTDDLGDGAVNRTQLNIDKALNDILTERPHTVEEKEAGSSASGGQNESGGQE